MPTDLEIARAAKMRPIMEIGAKLGVPADALEPYGRFKAKIGLDFVRSVQDCKDGALVLVTGISPTPAGEGKTTTTVGLGDALNKIGKRASRRAHNSALDLAGAVTIIAAPLKHYMQRHLTTVKGSQRAFRH